MPKLKHVFVQYKHQSTNVHLLYCCWTFGGLLLDHSCHSLEMFMFFVTYCLEDRDRISITREDGPWLYCSKDCPYGSTHCNLWWLLDFLLCFHFYLQKGMKLKELCKKRKGWKKKSWPLTCEDVPLLFGLIDIKIISRVLRMARISKEQLFWCEEKIKKLDLCDGKLQRDPSPILFPCW